MPKKNNYFELYSLKNRNEKKQFRREIIRVCRIEPPTFYSWINRGIVPWLAQLAIAAHLEITLEELFPEEEEELVTI